MASKIKKKNITKHKTRKYQEKIQTIAVATFVLCFYVFFIISVSVFHSTAPNCE